MCFAQILWKQAEKWGGQSSYLIYIYIYTQYIYIYTVYVYMCWGQSFLKKMFFNVLTKAAFIWLKKTVILMNMIEI